MSKIVTITFSPCIDKSAAVPGLIPEKKLRCESAKSEPGGGGINVARVINRLGGKALAIYPAGGYTGKSFNALLEKENVQSIIIETKNETRENFIVLDKSNDQQYRFGMPGTALLKSEWNQCLAALKDIHGIEFIVASGSLPPGVPLEIHARLAKIAKKKNAKLIVDTSGEALQHAVDEGVYLLKPNLGELATLVGVDKISDSQIHDIAKDLINKAVCRIIVISMGEKGAMLVTKNESHSVKPPTVKRKSTVGAGDSMVAGIVLSLFKRRPLEEVLRYGVACGTAATMNPGTELCKKTDVDKLFELMIPS